jgi:hypothetical protein
LLPSLFAGVPEIATMACVMWFRNGTNTTSAQ